MRVIEVFKARHRFAQEIFFDYLWEDHTEAELRTCPNDKLNSLVWNIWHVARVEDAGVSRFVMREPQLFIEGGWQQKLNIEVAHFGYGMSREDMLHLSANIDMAALKAYRRAVIDRTFDALGRLTPERMDETLSDAEIEAVMVHEGVGTPIVGTNVPYFGWTRLEALYHFSVTHYYWHGGEIRTLESLLP